MTQPTPPAGMSYAPAYDPSQEFDPQAAPVVVPGPEIARMEYFQQQEVRRTTMARVALLVVIFGMLAANMWQTQRLHDNLVFNIDQTRLAQAQLDDDAAVRIAELEAQITELDRQLTQQNLMLAQRAAEAPPAEQVAAIH